MAVQYQVVGACAHATVDGPSGRVRQLHFKGTLLPADVPQTEIDHLLSVGLVKAVGGLTPAATEPATPPQVTTAVSEPEPDEDAEPGDASVTDETAATEETADVPDQPEADPDVEAKRAAARAKLPADGSKPDGRAGQAVWVEYLVTKGYDYTTLAKADKKELVELAGSLQ